MTPPRPINYAHLDELGHAQNRAHGAIQKEIREGTLTRDRLLEIRETFVEEIRHLDVPVVATDSIDITVSVLGECTEEDIEVFLALNNMPSAEERQRRIEEARRGLADGR